METKIIKSAKRVLEVLEFFTAENNEATVMDISRTLDYPQSSTSELLRSLVTLGYLSYDYRRRTYRPTARVAVLGAWVQPFLFRRGHLLPMMDQLSRATGEMVVLAARVGLAVQYIHVIPATNPVRMALPQGVTRPLLRSAMGKLFLSTYPEQKVGELTHRLNADAEAEDRVRFADLKVELEQIRMQGYAMSLNTVNPGGGLLGILLPRIGDEEQLAIGFGGVSSVIEQNRDEFLSVLRAAVARHIGPLLPGYRPNGIRAMPSAAVASKALAESGSRGAVGSAQAQTPWFA